MKPHQKVHKKILSTTKPKPNTKTRKNESTATRNTRPKRLAAIRAAEVLAVMSYDDDQEDVEWWAREDLDVTGIEEPPLSHSDKIKIDLCPLYM